MPPYRSNVFYPSIVQNRLNGHIHLSRTNRQKRVSVEMTQVIVSNSINSRFELNF